MTPGYTNDTWNQGNLHITWILNYKKSTLPFLYEFNFQSQTRINHRDIPEELYIKIRSIFVADNMLQIFLKKVVLLFMQVM